MSELVSAGHAHGSLGGVVLTLGKTCKIAKTAAVFDQACWPSKTHKMNNSLCPCKSSLSCVFCALSFFFKSADFATVRHYLTMPLWRKLSTFNKTRAITWIQDGVSKPKVARRLHVYNSIIIRLHHRFLTTKSVEKMARSGRPRKTTSREDRFIERQVLQQRDATSTSIRR